MKLVHHNGEDLREIKCRGVQQPIEQDLRDDDQNPRLRIDAAVAGDEADVVGMKSPADGRFLQFLKFLFRQGNQGRGVVGGFAGVQGFEDGGFCNQRFTRSRRSAHQHAFFLLEPGQQRLFLNGVGLEGELVEVSRDEVIAGGGRCGHVG